MLVDAVLAVDLNPLEVVSHDEIDHACDRIRAINGRGAAGDDVDTLDELSGYLVDIRRRIGIERARITDPEPRPINQHEGSLRTKTAKIDRRNAASSGQGIGGIGEIGYRVLKILRQPVDEIADISNALQFEFLGRDDLNRTDAGHVRHCDARAGDDTSSTSAGCSVVAATGVGVPVVCGSGAAEATRRAARQQSRTNGDAKRRFGATAAINLRARIASIVISLKLLCAAAAPWCPSVAIAPPHRSAKNQKGRDTCATDGNAVD